MKMQILSKWQAMPLEAKASTAYAVCSIIQRSLSFITLPLFTRLLTTEQYGQLNVYTSWSAILAVFISLYLPFGSFGPAMMKFETRRDGYVASVDTVCLLLGGLFLAVYFPLRDFFAPIFELPAYLIVVMVLEIVANTAVQCWSAKERFEYKYKPVVFVTLLTSFLAPLVAFILVIHSEERGYARILGMAAVSIAIGGYFWIYNLKRGKYLYVKEFWKYALGFNIPLIPYYLSQMVFNQSDRIMISQLAGTDKAAIYGVACSLAMALMFIVNAINSSYTPWLYRKMKEQKWEANQKISFYIAGLMAFLFLMVIIFTPEIILLMAGQPYYEAVWVVPPVTMSMLALLYGQFFVNVQFYYEQRSNLLLGMISSGVINVVLNYICIPLFGFIAAAYTSLFCYVMNAALYYYFYKRVKEEKGIEEELVNMHALMLLAGVFTICSFGVMCLYDYRVVRFSLLCVMVGILYHYKSILYAQYKAFKSK